ncbi:MAG: adenylosuccinate lyase [Bacteroidia bacterium]|nr:adenylosuccinate lyase [Bacteroidia bacterium]MCX7651934.1 adenylosuccinate lyase [Bacteroidia bacterium]MDW8416085.1 adenylosuccinate lyase [Bacteroidia bacterium]
MGDLWALSPLDGRYKRYTEPLRAYLSEAAFFRYRLVVETLYFRMLAELPLPPLRDLPASLLERLEEAFTPFTDAILSELRTIEARTRHDVKAIEYFLRQRWSALFPPEYHSALAFIHFGLTSQDVNNTAQPLMLRDALRHVVYPSLEELIHVLHQKAYAWRDIVMLAFTHGQPASPTTLGKELYVYVERLRTELERLYQIPFWTKIGGAVGHLNAHRIAYPEIDWQTFFDKMAERLGLKRFYPTTQILPYERWGEIWDSLRRLQAVLIDFAQDIWLYAHRGYFRILKAEGQIGSSTMPHKTNPILFELAEGNLRLSNALWGFFTEKLPVSRLQRDLTDSTILRNLGVALGHGLIGIKSLSEGIQQLSPEPQVITSDLETHPEVVAEAWQTLRRKAGQTDAYEIAMAALNEGTLPLTELRPQEYIGYAVESVPPPQTSLE